MTYHDAINYLEEAKSRGSVPGLDSISLLCEKLGNPQKQSRFIHVGGTNGKGSVIAFISSILSEAGYRVGRYVSPAVFQYNEIIQIQTKDKIKYISDKELTEGVNKIWKAEQIIKSKGKNPPTLFEIETALAFLAFSDWGCDVVLLEVGLGGRLDATNIIENPMAVVMTPISLDHIKILGDTVAEIAEEKSGIIKENALFVTSEQPLEAMYILERVCEKNNSKLVLSKAKNIEILSFGLDGMKFCFEGISYSIGLIGEHQVQNALQAITTVRCLEGLKITQEHIKSGLKKARWDGRFQVIRNHPLTILDGAHNLAGACELKHCLECYLPDKDITGIMGVFADKDYDGICKEVLPLMKKVIVVPAEGERALPVEELLITARKYATDVTEENSVIKAYRKCIGSAGGSDALVVFGTLSFLSVISSDL